MEHLGPNLQKHRDWFDENNEEIQALLMKNQQLHKAYQNDQTSQSKKDAYRAIHQTVQAKQSYVI